MEWDLGMDGEITSDEYYCPGGQKIEALWSSSGIRDLSGELYTPFMYQVSVYAPTVDPASLPIGVWELDEISSEHTEILPGGTTTVTVSVDPAIEGAVIAMSRAWVPNTGGHVANEHDPTTGPGAGGAFEDSPISTGSDGTADVDFTASEFSGSWNLVATACGESIQAYQIVRVPNLVALGEGANWNLYGRMDEHPDAWYGTAQAITALQNIAASYHAFYPSAPVLEYNDCSLVWGGGFDLNTTWSTPSNPGHTEHRLGLNCDVNDVPEAREAKLFAFIQENNGSYDDKTTHYHVTFSFP
ncbi:MAG: hypothetical protein AMXMBFR84_08260 [Candidatus Hydrogenedentota bacterium]